MIIGDLADLKTADGAVAGVDYVVHLAAIPSVPRSIKDPLFSDHANVTGTLSVLVAAQRHGVIDWYSPVRRRSTAIARCCRSTKSSRCHRMRYRS